MKGMSQIASSNYPGLRQEPVRTHENLYAFLRREEQRILVRGSS